MTLLPYIALASIMAGVYLLTLAYWATLAELAHP